MILPADVQVLETLRKSKLRSAPSVRRNRIDDCDNGRNPRRKQQRYCYARHPKVRETLEAAGLSADNVARYGDTYDLCGTFCFENRLGSVCDTSQLLAFLQTKMSRRRAYRHLDVLEGLGLLTFHRPQVALHFYIEANPTRGEAESRRDDRRAQWRQSQARRRARIRVTRVTDGAPKCAQSQGLPARVNTQSSNKRCCTQRARPRGPQPGSLHDQLGRQIFEPPEGYFYNRQGHLQVMLSDQVVLEALLETENELYGPEV